MATGLDFACTAEQGFNFKQDEHQTFGYITSLVIGASSLSPDFKVADPLATPTVHKAAAGLGKAAESTSSSKFVHPAVGVLDKVAWPTNATDKIEFEARISATNMQLISNLLMQNMPKVVVKIAFIVYVYDPNNQVYYPAFKTYQGTAPLGEAPGDSGGGFGANTNVPEVFGILTKEGGAYSMSTSITPEDEPTGFVNFKLNITVSPTAAGDVQQLQVQTSSVAKMIKPWGLPRS